MSSIDHNTGFYKPSPNNTHRSNRVGSFGSSSSNGSNISSLSYSSISYEQMLPPPPNVFGSGIARPSSRGNGNPSISSGRNKPSPVNFSKPNDDLQITPPDQAIPSPRAALVAGLRSATDRRQQQREQQQQQQKLLRMQGSSLYDTMNGGNSGLYSSNFANQQNYSTFKSPVTPSFGLSPPTSPIPNDYSDSSLNNSPFTTMGDRPDSRILASLHQKHQELMATSVAIAQQQQRLAQAINQAALSYGGYYNLNDSSFDVPVLSSSPGVSRSPIITPQPLQSSQQQYDRNSIYNDLPAPPGYNNFYRPSSPSVPVRPSSSSSFRPQISQNSPKQSQANSPGYRRSHRKAASLSGSGSSFGSNGTTGNFSSKNFNGSNNATHYHSSGSFVSGGSSSLSNSGGGSQLRNSMLNPGALGKGSEIPLRQPVGPPPIEELKGQKFGLNFAMTSTINSF